MNEKIPQKHITPQALLRTILILFFIPAGLMAGVFEMMRPRPDEVRLDLSEVMQRLEVGATRQELFEALPQGRLPHLGIHRITYGHYHIGMQRPWYRHLWLNTLGGGIPTPYRAPYIDVKLKDELVHEIVIRMQ